MPSPLSTLPFVEWTEPDSGEAVRLYADLVKAESPDLPAIVTKHPVERGAPITDHFRKDLETLSVTFFFAGSPLRGDLDPDNPGDLELLKLPRADYSQQVKAPIFTPGGATQAIEGAISSGLSALLGGSGQPTSFKAMTFDVDPRKRFAKVLEIYRRLQAKAILVRYHSNMLGEFENMAVTNVKPSRTVELQDGMDLEVEFQQVQFVTSDVSFGAPLPTEPRGQTKKTGVNASGEEVTDQKKKTALRGLVAG